MSNEPITHDSCLQALRAIRYDRALPDNPILGTAVVSELLVAEGLSDTLESRQWILTQLLSDLVWAQLDALRGRDSRPTWRDLPPEREQELLLEDCRSKSEERRYWGLLYYRYLCSRRVGVSDIAARLSVTRRTLSRWLARGQHLLLEALRAREAEAIRHRRQRAERESGDAILGFLFTDVEGSTKLWETHPRQMRAALLRYSAIIEEAVHACGGRVFKTVGDACRASFINAGDAQRAAVRAQRALLAEHWPRFGEPFARFRVRMAVHAGEAREIGSDYFGNTINRVARLAAAGHGGQILLSSIAAQLARDHLPESAELRDWGEHRLKDLRHTERIYQLVAPRLSDVGTAPDTEARLDPPDRILVVEDAEALEVEFGGEHLWRELGRAISSSESRSITLTGAQAESMARHSPASLREYWLGRIAEWSQPRYRLDEGFVHLGLVIDKDRDPSGLRWAPEQTRFSGLGELLNSLAAPALVLLGPPGSGKSTLLRRLELDSAVAGLRQEHPAAVVSFLVPLNLYDPGAAEGGNTNPGTWLAGVWASRYPDLPDLGKLLAEGRMLILLDGLNEMPADSESQLRRLTLQWKRWLHGLVVQHRGNRVVFSCRSLDYSQPLSTPELRVPQVQIEALDEASIRAYLELKSPGRWREIWSAVEDSPMLEVLGSPYLLNLLVEQVEATGELPAGRAALFTGFVRQALRRELERGNPLFDSDQLLTPRDRARLTHWRWHGAYDLPERGSLLRKLSELAFAMQERLQRVERSQIRLDVDKALELLQAEGETCLPAGLALHLLDEDQADETVMFSHQLVQEYFAARKLARAPRPELVRIEWRADRTRPSLDEVLSRLDPNEPLPPLPQSGWEETTLLAAAMTDHPPSFLEALKECNLALAGRAAASSDLRQRLPDSFVVDLRKALLDRSREPRADLRDRLACANTMAALGDPRLERQAGPLGDFILPKMIPIPAGVYPIGSDEPLKVHGHSYREHCPAHSVALDEFSIAAHPVTNAEWQCFIEAGGYEDERWWPDRVSRSFLRGEISARAATRNNRLWRARFIERPETLEEFAQDGVFDPGAIERMRAWVAMNDEDFEADMRAVWTIEPVREPFWWRHEGYELHNQPVTGIGWYEARAYTLWLRAQTGLEFRLPSEVEWEAAARGRSGRRYPWGDRPGHARGNCAEAHLRRPCPIGLFPEGDTTEGIGDLVGNVLEWTSSAYGEARSGGSLFAYPYQAADGREASTAASSVKRVARGGSWMNPMTESQPHVRTHVIPSTRFDYGLRLARSQD